MARSNPLRRVFVWARSERQNRQGAAKISKLIEQIDHVVHRLRALQARKKRALGEANAHEYCVIARDEAFDALQEAFELLGQYKRCDVTPEQAKNASRWVAMTPTEKNAVYDRIE